MKVSDIGMFEDNTCPQRAASESPPSRANIRVEVKGITVFTPRIYSWNLTYLSYIFLSTLLPVPCHIVLCSSQARQSWPIIQRANYVSGRDRTSTMALSSLLGRLKAPRAKPHEVARIRDPVLSDRYFMDVEGACWKQSEGTIYER